jgi:hypothetical protein
VYGRGEECGNSDKSATLVFRCEHDSFEVISVDDSVPCDYMIVLGLPMHCSLLIGKSPGEYQSVLTPPKTSPDNTLEIKPDVVSEAGLILPDDDVAQDAMKAFFHHDPMAFEEPVSEDQIHMNADSVQLQLLEEMKMQMNYIQNRLDVLVASTTNRSES